MEKADVILLAGTNPDTKSPSSIRAYGKAGYMWPDVRYIGERANTADGYDYLGGDPKVLAGFVVRRGPFRRSSRR